MSREGVGKGKPGQSKREEPLGKRERALRAFDGQEVDKRPFTFWHPFGLSHMKGESLSASALTFAAVYGVDLLRMPAVRDLPLPPQTSIDRAHDLTTFEPMTGRQGFWGERLEALKSIVRLADSRIAVFETLVDPLTALSWACPPEILASAERGHRSFVDKAIGTLTESYKAYLKILLTEAKVDGVVLEVGSASYENREPEDFESLVKPHLRSLLDEIRTHDSRIWLHVTGKRTYLEPLLGLPHDLLSWPHLAHGPSLDKLPRSYKGRVAGGLNELTVQTASYQDIRRQVDEARNYSVALLCPGDALSADMAPSKLQGLANFLMKRDRAPEASQKGGRTAAAESAAERPPIIDEP